jgi:predicted metal-dependent hydrolase
MWLPWPQETLTQASRAVGGQERRTTRKWGSCSTAGTVTLAIDLDEQSGLFQDFVIVHELLHLKAPNHGRLFKALMTIHVPDRRSQEIRRKWRPGNARHR